MAFFKVDFYGDKVILDSISIQSWLANDISMG